jgi:hypothetical protein
MDELFQGCIEGSLYAGQIMYEQIVFTADRNSEYYSLLRRDRVEKQLGHYQGVLGVLWSQL